MGSWSIPGKKARQPWHTDTCTSHRDVGISSHPGAAQGAAPSPHPTEGWLQPQLGRDGEIWKGMEIRTVSMRKSFSSQGVRQECEHLGLCSGTHHPELGSISKLAKHQDPASAPSLLPSGRTPVLMPDGIVPPILTRRSLSLRNIPFLWAHPGRRMWNVSILTAPNITVPIPLSAGGRMCLELSSARTNSFDAQSLLLQGISPPSPSGK